MKDPEKGEQRAIDMAIKNSLEDLGKEQIRRFDKQLPVFIIMDS